MATFSGSTGRAGAAELVAHREGRPSSQYLSWLEPEQLGDAATTSNVHGAALAFQRWYRFKEAFSPQFVLDVVKSLPKVPRTCTDPFGGSGTTALTCQFVGIRPTTIEVNPFLADLIESKLVEYRTSEVIAARAQLAERIASAMPRARRTSSPFPGAPDTFVEPGRDGRWIFDASVARRIACYRAAIDGTRNPALRRLFRVLLAGVLIPVSNVTISGKGRRYRRESARQQSTPHTVDRLFEEAFQRALYDICRYRKRSCSEYTILRGDARARLEETEAADLILFSPPYPNSFDYTDVYNVELWALSYLQSGTENRALREATLRSHVQIKRDFSTDKLHSRTLQATLASLGRKRSRLWNPHIPSMVQAYAQDLLTILSSARRVLTRQGRVVLVVGASRYAGVAVDVPRIVAELAPSAGLRCESRREVRAMRSSAQQGGHFTLGEALVRLAPA